jgi:nucleoside-diphosphate-sugar epimerase
MAEIDRPRGFWDSKRVLITGGLGFIGSNLAIRLVEEGAKVTLVDSLREEYGGNLRNVEPIRQSVKIDISDVRDLQSFRQLIGEQEFLFNLAGQTSHLDSMEDPYTDLDINVKAQVTILEVCRRYNPEIRIVFASTRQIYGRPQYLPVDEKHPLRPVDVNGVNKMAGEQYHLLYHDVFGMKTRALRLTNTYGPRMRVKDARQTFLGIWVRNLLSGSPLEVWGGGQLRDFNYVDDVVEALLLASVAPEAEGKVINLGGSERISLKGLAELMIKIGGKGSYTIREFPEERKRIDIGDYYSDFSLAVRILGWQPKVGLGEGLARTLEYFSGNRAHYF